MNVRHRPPHGLVKIRELIKLGKCNEAQRCCDQNVEFYRQKIADQQQLYIDAQCVKMNVKPRDSLERTMLDIAITGARS